uniref:Retrotransposon gag domain-containing protein n=1 Tax=Opuntia streptacantha TaxID=393608 RepID=A0A7C8ZXR5_OPUST
MNSVSEAISRSVLYVESAREIWLQLEKRFRLSNGSRKYRLNKDVYSIKQNGSSVSDYYTRIKGIWEELDSMVDLPKVSVANEEIAAFLRAFGRMQEQQKLF